jgi:hypothetical protein
VGLERGPLSLVNAMRSYLEEKLAASICKGEITAGEIRCADHATPLCTKVGTNFADKRGREVGIVRSRTKATKLLLLVLFIRSSTSSTIHVVNTFM